MKRRELPTLYDRRRVLLITACFGNVRYRYFGAVRNSRLLHVSLHLHVFPVLLLHTSSPLSLSFTLYAVYVHLLASNSLPLRLPSSRIIQIIT